MEKSMKGEQVSLIEELTQGEMLANQLCHLLNSPSSFHETSELIERIISSYDKALKMLNWGAKMGEANTTIGGSVLDSHCSFGNGSPSSEVLDQHNNHKDVFKKRKTMPRWTEQVKVCSGTGLEGSLDDGYSWRKYGQKDILGAKFPRGYYRCTHRNVQGCLATKQVQRSDMDGTIFEVTYRGRHTCTQASRSNKAFSKAKMGLGENQFHNHQRNQPDEEDKNKQCPETFFNLGAELEVKLEDLDTKEDIFPSFCFSSPSIGSENGDNNIFTDTMMESQFMEALISTATSESNIFCLSSACPFGSTGVLGQSVQTSESGITEIVSAPTSVTNSPILDLDLLLDKEDFDANFPFDTSELFSS